MLKFGHWAVSAVILLVSLASPSLAQTSTDRAIDDAVAQAYAQGIAGPTTVRLRDMATLDVPKDFVFIPGSGGSGLMHGIGNASEDALLGLVLPAHSFGGWFIAVTAAKTGFVSKEAAAKLDHAEILAAVQASARRGNAERMKLGSGPIEAGAWVEPPRYDVARHQITTAVRIYESGPSTGGEDSINIDVNAFGRTHTIELALVAGLSDNTKQRPTFDQLVASFKFLPGHRADDFIPGKDLRASHIVDIVFGGHTLDDLAAEAAEAAAEHKRVAALPPPPDRIQQIKLLFSGLLGVVALIIVVLALRGARGAPAPGGATGLDRATRAAPRR